MSRKTYRAPLTLLFLSVLAFGYYMLSRLGMLEVIMDAEVLREWVDELDYWGPLGIIALMAIAVVINPIPSAPIALASGAAFGHTWGTIYVIIGAGSGALIAFCIARLLGYGVLQRFFGERVKLGWLGSQNTLTGIVLVSRLLPFISFDLVSYGAGLTPIKTWRFTLATLIGLIPASFLLAHFGGELTTSSLEQAIVILLVLGLIVTAPLVLKIFMNWLQHRNDS